MHTVISVAGPADARRPMWRVLNIYAHCNICCRTRRCQETYVTSIKKWNTQMIQHNSLPIIILLTCVWYFVFYFGNFEKWNKIGVTQSNDYVSHTVYSTTFVSLGTWPALYVQLYTVRKFNWWRYCLALYDEIFYHFPLFDETLRYIERCKSVISQI